MTGVSTVFSNVVLTANKNKKITPLVGLSPIVVVVRMSKRGVEGSNLDWGKRFQLVFPPSREYLRLYKNWVSIHPTAPFKMH